MVVVEVDGQVVRPLALRPFEPASNLGRPVAGRGKNQRRHRRRGRRVRLGRVLGRVQHRRRRRRRVFPLPINFDGNKTLTSEEQSINLLTLVLHL